MRLKQIDALRGLAARRDYWKALAVVALGIAFRAYFTGTASSTPPGDPNAYQATVNAMLAGDGMVFHDWNLGDLHAFCPPLYVSLLWLVSLPDGLTFGAVGGLNLVIDLGTAGAILWLGRLAGARLGLAAAAYFLWPPTVILSATPYKEGLICLLTTLLACFTLVSSDKGAVGFGVTAALLALTQPALAPLAGFFAIAFRPPVRFLGFALCAAVAVMMPWWIRNWLLFDRFVPLTSAGGLGLWIGVTPEGSGTYLMTPARFIVGDEFAISRAAASEAWRIILADPLGTALHCLAKLWRALIDIGWANATIKWLDHQAPLALIVSAMVPLFLLPPALWAASAAKLFFRRDGILSAFLLAGAAQFFFGQFLFETSERHRYFLIPLALAFLLSRYESSRTTSRW